MAYYAFASTANFILTAYVLIRMYVYQKNAAVKRSYVHGVGNFE